MKYSIHPQESRMVTVRRSDERGVALILTLFLSLVVAGMAVGVILMASNSNLIAKFHSTEAMMAAAADAGLEQGRDTLNGTPGIVPVGLGFVTLETNAVVRDANGVVIPGFTRSLYAGENGDTSGQHGVFASIISVISNTRGAVVVRRAQLAQESFAKFARFDDQTTSSIRFANGIQVFGPLHTNQTLYVGPNSGPMPTFWGPVTTASTISTTGAGVFQQGYQINVPVIPMPTPATLASLSAYAVTGNTWLTGGTIGTGVMNPNTRIEFIPIDVNLDGDFTDDNEGFFRVYRANGATANHLNYITARVWNTGSATDPNATSPNCGDAANGTFVTAAAHVAGGPVGHNHSGVLLTNQRNSLNHATRRCFLGGDPRLTNGFVVNTPAPGNYGSWQAWPGWGGAPPAAIQNAALPAAFGGGTVGAAMAQYLWPINRTYNINFKGVIYVQGSVGVSGLLRGRVTVAAAGNIMLADDLTYTINPGSDPDCDSDIFGVLTPQFFMLEDNNVNSPFENNNIFVTGYDESGDENLHGAVLTLNSIQAENVSGGSTDSHICVGTNVGRGCFNMSGSAIQGINGSRMTSSGTGWNPQWTYDRCMAINPPPYYPTTGRYYKNRYYEMDPVGFNVAAWFAANQ
jgi:hypothetical protein